MHRRNNYAVSELLGIIYILIISTTLISAIYVWAPQQLEEQKSRIRSDSALNQFETIDNVLQNIISQGAGNSNTVNFVADEGYMHIGSGGTRLVTFYSMLDGFDFHVSDLGIDDDDPEDEAFTYIQKTLPEWWEDLRNEDKKITLNISYLNDGTSEQNVSYASVTYPNAAPSLIRFYYNPGENIDPGSWHWDFDSSDGSDENGDSTEQNPTHTFGGPGDVDKVYTVTLTATANGEELKVKHDVIVGDPFIPHAAFSYTPVNPTTADEIVFADESANAALWHWDFGDGDVSTDQNPIHRYKYEVGESYPKDYTVKLTVNKYLDDESEESHLITVGNGPPFAAFLYEPSSPITKGTQITFTDESTDPDGDNIDSWSWDFHYDGTFNEESDVQNPGPITYSDANIYTVALTVTDDAVPPNANTVIHDIVIVDTEEEKTDIRAAFSYSPVNPNAMDLIQLNDESVNAFFMWIWYLDGKILVAQPSHPEKQQWFKNVESRYHTVTLAIQGAQLPDGDPMYIRNHTVYINSFDFSYCVDNTWDVTVDEENSLSDAVQIDIITVDWDKYAKPEIDQDGGLYAIDLSDNNLDYTFKDYNDNGVYDSGDAIVHRNPDGLGLDAYPSRYDVPKDPGGLCAQDENGEPYIFNDITGDISWVFDDEDNGGDSVTYYTAYPKFLDPDSDGAIADPDKDAGQKGGLYARDPYERYTFEDIYSPYWKYGFGELLTSNPEGENIVAGKIWLFDLGFIRFEASSGQTVREIVFENGAVVSASVDSGYLVDEPDIYIETGTTGEGTGVSIDTDFTQSFIMRITQFKSEDEITIGPGSSTYRLILKLNSSGVRENNIIYYNILKMQVFGDRGSAWTNFFKFKYGFENSEFIDDTDDTICYTPDTSYRRVMLAHSLFDIDLEVV